MALQVSGLKKIVRVLTAGILLLSCKATEKDTQSLLVQDAYWYNWSGGLAGIGGTNYEIQVETPVDGDISFDSLVLDGEKLAVEQKKAGKNVYRLFVSVDKSNKNDVIGSERTGRPDFRRENPENAYLTGTINGKAFELEISTFERKETQNMW